jgi:WhiB family redox-sensing transcriptional regulator
MTGFTATKRLVELLAATADEDWQERALCAQVAEVDLFFPDQCVNTGPAKRICDLCEVRAERKDYAVEERIDHGVWGGLSPAERREMWPRDDTKRVTEPLRKTRRERDAEIMRLHAAGETAPAIAGQVGVTPRTVVRAIARNTTTRAPRAA